MRARLIDFRGRLCKSSALSAITGPTVGRGISTGGATGTTTRRATIKRRTTIRPRRAMGAGSGGGKHRGAADASDTHRNSGHRTTTPGTSIHEREQ